MKPKRHPPKVTRRDFVRSCAGLMALGLNVRARSGEFDTKSTYRQSRLVDKQNKPVTVDELRPGETYIFHYPFRATPCFLIKFSNPVVPGKPLETESGERYRWPGGAGPRQSVVAFSAICAHKMTHPAKSVSFINYRPENITYKDSEDTTAQGRHLIYCCSENSVYDPRDGARVLGGPAKQPLAAIGLEYEEANDSLLATGTFGGEMFDKFFTEFKTRLQLEYGVSDVDTEVGETTVVRHIDDFTDSVVLCG